MLIWMHKVNYKTFGFNMWGKVWSNKKKPRSSLNFEKKLKQDQSSNCEIKWRSWYRFLALIWCSSGSGWDFSQLIDWNKPSFIFWRTHRDFKSQDIPHVPLDIVLTGSTVSSFKPAVFFLIIIFQHNPDNCWGDSHREQTGDNRNMPVVRRAQRTFYLTDFYSRFVFTSSHWW